MSVHVTPVARRQGMDGDAHAPRHAHQGRAVHALGQLHGRQHGVIRLEFGESRFVSRLFEYLCLSRSMDL